MKIIVFQPPYPKESTIASAGECLQWMRQRLDELERGGQDLVLLPEYANAPGLTDPGDIREFSARQGADFIKAAAASAKRLDSLVVLSGVVPRGALWFNRTMVFDSRGELAATYDKMHLTDVEIDELGLSPGAKPTIFEHRGIRMGFATCFDLYFPEYFAALAAQAVDMVLCPSYQRSETPDRIGLIAQARALDTGAYLARSSYSMGQPNAGGRSLVATPTGAVLADAGSVACVLSAELDPKQKFVKPASHGQKPVEHRALIESHRRAGAYRPRPERARQVAASPFPRLCAHRGLSQACPENTLPAFAAAMACGAHEIEFDLWTSRDGVPVVCHDPSVDRTTNGKGNIAELDWDDIRRLDAGVRLGGSWEGVHVPRLEEVLEVVDGRIGLNIHIKEGGPDGITIRRVCDLLIKDALTDIAYVALETEAALQIAHDYAPDIPRACLACQDDPPKSIAVAQRWACQRIQFSRQVTRDQICRVREAGLICNLFWSDQPEDAMRYVRNGIDVILTNCAHTMVAGGFHALGQVPANQRVHAAR